MVIMVEKLHFTFYTTHLVVVVVHVGELVVHEIVKRYYGSNQGSQVYHEVHIVGLHEHGARHVFHVQVWEQVQDGL